MADTLTSATTLLIENLFLDGDTRTITLKNPKNNVSSSDMENLNTLMQTSQIIIGDRDSSEFRKIKRATRRVTNILNYDLG